MKILYCLNCLKNISNHGEIAKEVFETVCEYYITNKSCAMITRQSSSKPLLSIVNFLESKGYVLTKEHEEDSILVKPLGMTYDEDEDAYIFCFTRNK